MISNLWAAFPMPDDTVKAVGDVGVQASGQVPWFAYPVIVFSSVRDRKPKPISIHLIYLSQHPLELIYVLCLNTSWICALQCKDLRTFDWQLGAVVLGKGEKR